MHAPLPRLLLVEDDAVSRAFLAEALAGLPATVDIAGSIAQACALATGPRHSLWLVDAHLPDGSGAECLRSLGALCPGVPAAAITAESRRDLLDPLCAAGFMEVLQKPIGLDALQVAVRRLLDGTRTLAAIEGEKQPAWDEARALAAVGGNAASLAALRELFLAELPAQAARIRVATSAGDHDAVLAELHRLKASCAFVGAARLQEAARALSAGPGDASLLQRFVDAVEDTLRSDGRGADAP